MIHSPSLAIQRLVCFMTVEDKLFHDEFTGAAHRQKETSNKLHLQGSIDILPPDF